MENPRLTSSRHVIIEVFTEGCPSCEGTAIYASQLACSAHGYEVRVWNVNEGCAKQECRTRMESYGIKELPAIVIDGKLLACCS